MTDPKEELELPPKTSSKHRLRTAPKASTAPPPSNDVPTDPICKPPNANNFVKYREFTEYIRNSGVLKVFGRCILSIYGSKSWPPQEKLMEQILNGMGDQIADKKVITELSNQKKSLHAKLEAMIRERNKLFHELDEFEGSGLYFELEDADSILNPMPDNQTMNEELLNDLFSRMQLPPDSRDNESSSPLLGGLMETSRMPEGFFQEEAKTSSMNLVKLLEEMLTTLGYLKVKNRDLTAQLSTNKQYMNKILQALKTERPERFDQIEEFEDRFASYGLLEIQPQLETLSTQEIGSRPTSINKELLTNLFGEMEELTPDSRDDESPDWLFACSEEPQIFSKPCNEKRMPV